MNANVRAGRTRYVQRRRFSVTPLRSPGCTRTIALLIGDRPAVVIDVWRERQHLGATYLRAEHSSSVLRAIRLLRRGCRGRREIPCRPTPGGWLLLLRVYPASESGPARVVIGVAPPGCPHAARLSVVTDRGGELTALEHAILELMRINTAECRPNEKDPLHAEETCRTDRQH